jgi:hypothetical protein
LQAIQSFSTTSSKGGIATCRVVRRYVRGRHLPGRLEMGGGPEGGDLFAERGGPERFATVLLSPARGDVPLQVSEGQPPHTGPPTQGFLEVLQVHSGLARLFASIAP